MFTEQFLPIAMGFVFGVIVALAVFVAELAVRRWIPVGSLFDVVLRLCIFAAIVIGVSEFIGALFGPLVRTHTLGFWGSFVIGFILPPWLVRLHLRRAERKNVG
jgi:hypothetical protein